MRVEMNRRTVLHSAAVAAGTVVMGGLVSEPSRAGRGTESASVPVEGRLVAWLRLDTAGCAAMRLVELDATSRPMRDVAVRQWVVGSVAAAQRGADARALDAVARSWGVPPQSCRVEAGRIVQAGGGRAAEYAVWMDVV